MTHRLEEGANAVVLAPAAPATASVIWLHGLGADGHDFVPIVPELGLPAVRFVFPHAPVRPVTLNMGMRMRAWYDIRTLTAEGRADEEGIRASVELARGYIAAERAVGIASQRILLAGFSQGGAIALHAGLRHAEPLAGIIGLSAYLPLQAALAGELAAANRATPILMCHGLYDPVLPHALGVMARDWLREQGYVVEWREYPMQHQVCMPEIEEIGRWLRARLGAVAGR
ncbi:MAG: alpha/beta hydrolase [Gammaproteobacteria bacterium]